MKKISFALAVTALSIHAQANGLDDVKKAKEDSIKHQREAMAPVTNLVKSAAKAVYYFLRTNYIP